MNKKMNKKGQAMDQLGALGIGIASLIIIFAVVFLITSNVKSNTQVAADTYALNATHTLTTAAEGIPDWVGLVVIAVIGAILLSLVSIFRR